MSAGWSCYDWLFGTRNDSDLTRTKLLAMLIKNNFIMSIGISYLPLHEEVKKIAQEVGMVDVFKGQILCQTNVATQYIQNVIDKRKLGFKHKNVRC